MQWLYYQLWRAEHGLSTELRECDIRALWVCESEAAAVRAEAERLRRLQR